MSEDAPVDTIEATFVDDVVADEVAAAMNVWFRWIVEGSEGDVPSVFEPFGFDAAEYAWSLEDVDWNLGPHARAVGNHVRISLETHDTWKRISGLLRGLGATAVTVSRET